MSALLPAIIEQGLVNQVHTFARVKGKEVHQAAFGIAEGGIGVGVALQIIVVAVLVEVKGQLGRLFRRYSFHVSHVFRLTAFRFALAGGAGVGKAFLHAVDLRVEKPVAPDQAGVEHAERGDCLETLVRLCGFQGVASSAANAQDAQTGGVHSGILQQDVCGAADVFHAVGGFVRIAGSPSAGPLVGRVKCQADVALFRHALAVKSGHLLLHAAVGMRHDKGGVFFEASYPAGV